MRDTAIDNDRHPLTDEELMQDIYDGTEWVKQEIGLKRMVEQDGSIIDVEDTPGSRCSLFSCEVGLSMTINIDWYVHICTLTLFCIDFPPLGSLLLIIDLTLRVSFTYHSITFTVQCGT